MNIKTKTVFLIVLSVSLVWLVYLGFSKIFVEIVVYSAKDDKHELFKSGTNKEIIKYFNSKNTSINKFDFFTLIDNERNDILEMLLKDNNINPDLKIKSDETTPLLYASENLKLKPLSLFVKYGANVNRKNENGDTALLLALKNYQYSMNDVNSQILEISKVLIKANAKVNVSNSMGLTLVNQAALSNNIVLLKYYIENGGDKFLIDEDGYSSIFYCKSIECFRYLVSLGHNINSVNKYNKNVLQSIVDSSRISTKLLNQLVELDVDVCHIDDNGKNVLDYVEIREINSSLLKDNSKGYDSSILENKNSDVYHFLDIEYNKKCTLLGN